ncbi:MAG TPA: tetratricopeptide repeat protein [Aggregatilineaceae bacterium]|nr:tetratricopeptide repeat protein [Aggregatilineaceae bacterium]
MMTWLLVWAAILPVLPGIAGAQAAESYAIGDVVLVVTSRLPVHVQPSLTSGVAAEMVVGMKSRIIAMETDVDRLTWFYLSDSALGWVPGRLNGLPSLALFSDAALDTMLAQATTALERNPNDAEAYVKRGTVYLTQREYDLAVADYAQAVRFFPKNGALHDNLGKAYLDARRYTEAQAELEQAIKLGWELPNTYNRLGIACDKLGDYAYAAVSYMQGLAIEPGYGILYNNQGVMFDHLGIFDQAIIMYGQAIQADPYLATAYVNRGIAYYKQDNFSAALADYSRAIEINPYLAQAYVERGAYYADVNYDFEAALADYNRAIDLDPADSSAYSSRGVTYSRYGQLFEARADLLKAIELDPTNREAHFGLGTMYGRFGEYALAADAYSRAIELGGWTANIPLLYRAQDYFFLGQYERVVEDLDAYLEWVDVEFEGGIYLTITAYLVRGAAYLRLGDEDPTRYQLAAQDYQAAFALDSSLAREFYTWGGRYGVILGGYEQALALQDRVDAEPQSVTLWLDLAHRYMQYGQFPEAVESYQQYITLADHVPPELEQFVTTIADLIG